MQDHEPIREEFNRWAAEGMGEEMAEGHRDITEQALDRVTFSAADRALDVGCGIGWATHLMKERGAGEVIGVDLSEAMIARARPAPGVSFQVGVATALPFPDEHFTRVLAVESLYYCPDLDAALKEIHRVCQSGARFLCVIDLFKENPGSHAWIEALAVQVHLLSAGEYVKRFEGAGFSEVEAVQIRERKPMPRREDFTPSRWFPAYERYVTYREIGGLVIDAHG